MPEPAQPDRSFPKTRRVRHRTEFDRIFRQGRVAADHCLVVRAVRNGLDRTRLGLVVGRRVGNAPERNRWKRLIREAFRTAGDQLPPGLDITVRPRRGAVVAPRKHTGPPQPKWESLATIRQSLVRLCRRLDRQLPPVGLRPSNDKEGAE